MYDTQARRRDGAEGRILLLANDTKLEGEGATIFNDHVIYPSEWGRELN